jgi:hypothetical protein
MTTYSRPCCLCSEPALIVVKNDGYCKEHKQIGMDTLLKSTIPLYKRQIGTGRVYRRMDHPHTGQQLMSREATKCR